MQYSYPLLLVTVLLSQINELNANELNANELIANEHFTDSMVKLTTDNFIVIRGPITDASMAQSINQLIKLKPNKVYVYISSHGGSVFAGLQFVQAMKTLQKTGKKVYTIADFSASMAYIIHQYGTDRLVRPWGVLMQHQMSYAIEGNFNNVQSYHNFISQINTQLNKYQAERSNMTSTYFNELTEHDLWLVGQSAVDLHMADYVVDIYCDFVADTYKEEVMTLFGLIEISFSNCPLISSPLKIDMKLIDKNHYSDIYKMYDIDNYIKK